MVNKKNSEPIVANVGPQKPSPPRPPPPRVKGKKSIDGGNKSVPSSENNLTGTDIHKNSQKGWFDFQANFSDTKSKEQKSDLTGFDTSTDSFNFDDVFQNDPFSNLGTAKTEPNAEWGESNFFNADFSGNFNSQAFDGQKSLSWESETAKLPDHVFEGVGPNISSSDFENSPFPSDPFADLDQSSSQVFDGQKSTWGPGATKPPDLVVESVGPDLSTSGFEFEDSPFPSDPFADIDPSFGNEVFSAAPASPLPGSNQVGQMTTLVWSDMTPVNLSPGQRSPSISSVKSFNEQHEPAKAEINNPIEVATDLDFGSSVSGNSSSSPMSITNTGITSLNNPTANVPTVDSRSLTHCTSSILELSAINCQTIGEEKNSLSSSGVSLGMSMNSFTTPVTVSEPADLSENNNSFLGEQFGSSDGNVDPFASGNLDPFSNENGSIFPGENADPFSEVNVDSFPKGPVNSIPDTFGVTKSSTFGDNDIEFNSTNTDLGSNKNTDPFADLLSSSSSLSVPSVRLTKDNQQNVDYSSIGLNRVQEPSTTPPPLPPGALLSPAPEMSLEAAIEEWRGAGNSASSDASQDGNVSTDCDEVHASSSEFLVWQASDLFFYYNISIIHKENILKNIYIVRS